MKKLICFAAVLALLLCGCGAKEVAETTAPEATQETTPPEPDPVEAATEKELIAALAESAKVVLTADIKLPQALDMQTLDLPARTLDGNGYTITGRAYDKENTATENVLQLRYGTVQNVTVKGSYRTLGDSADCPMVGEVYLKNVSTDDTTVAMHVGRGSTSGKLYAEDCTFRGWTIISQIQDVKINNCTFGYTSEGKDGYFRTFRAMTLTNCNFESFVKEDGTVLKYNISFHPTASGVTLCLTDCYVDGTLITQENIESLLNITLLDNQIAVRNTVS